MNNEDIALSLKVSRPFAARVKRWLGWLHEADCVHGECGVVAMAGSKDDVGLLVATVDYRAHDVGCAWCGEWQASHGQPLASGAVLVRLDSSDLPRELKGMFSPAVLYCSDCWKDHGRILQSRYKL